jgi:hypothetical protein
MLSYICAECRKAAHHPIIIKWHLACAYLTAQCKRLNLVVSISSEYICFFKLGLDSD